MGSFRLLTGESSIVKVPKNELWLPNIKDTLWQDVGHGLVKSNLNNMARTYQLIVLQVLHNGEKA